MKPNSQKLPPRRKILINNLSKRKVNPAAIRAIIHALDAAPIEEKVPEGELSIVLMTDEGIAAVHEQFLQDPTPTDVITFLGHPLSGTAGEICISTETAEREADKRSLPLAQEVALYLIHGWLHLAGHDDLSPAPRRRMRLAEKKAFRQVDPEIVTKLIRI